MNDELILKIGAAGGSLSLYRDRRVAAGAPAFYLHHQEHYDLDAADGGDVNINTVSPRSPHWLDCLLGKGGRKYWWRLFCLFAHPDFRGEILNAVEAAGGFDARQRWQARFN